MRSCARPTESVLVDQPQDSELKDNIPLGILAAIAAFLMFSIMITLAKLLVERHSVIEIAFYRNLIACIPFLVAVFFFRRRDILRLRRKPKIVGLRAVFGVVSLSLTFYAYSLMPMADATALRFTSSLIVPMLGILMLGEHVGAYRWSAVLLGFAGVVIMLQPGGGAHYFGAAIALSAAAIQAVMQIMLRFLRGYEKPETVAFYFVLIGTIVTALPLPFIFVMPTSDELPLIVGLGLAGALAQWMLTLAYSLAPVAIVSVLNYSSILWATLFGWFVFADWPADVVFVGAAVVILSNAFVIWRESKIAAR